MNELVLNELSFLRFRQAGNQCAADSREEARAWMGVLVRVLAEASRAGFPRSIRIVHELLYRELAPGYTLVQWRNDSAVNRDERRLWGLYSTRTPLLDGTLKEIVDRARCCQAFVDGVEGRGLLASLVLDALAISLPSDPAWSKQEVCVRLVELAENDELIESEEWLAHASEPEHLRLLGPRIQEERRGQVKSGRDLLLLGPQVLPNLRFCGDVPTTLAELGENDPQFGWVKRCLFELNDCCGRWDEMGFPHTTLRAKPSPESRSVWNDATLRAMRVFLCPDGQQLYFDWHMKGPGIRLHYYPQDAQRIVLIGYIGRHLRTSLF